MKYVAACLIAFAGCVPGSYVAADRATFEAVAPAYIAYVGSDSTLTDKQRDRKQRVIDSWRFRLEAGE